MSADQLMKEFFDKEKEKINKEQDTETQKETTVETTEVKAGVVETKETDVWSPVVGKHFKSPEEFNSFYETANKWKEENEKLNSVLSEIEDPSTYFSSPESYKREQLLKVRPDISLEVADKIVKSDIKTLTPVEKLELEMLLENPDIKGGLDGVKELIKDKYGLEDGEEIPRHIENKILIDSKSAEKKLEATRMELKVFEKRDYKAQFDSKRAEFDTQVRNLEEGWKGAYDKVGERIKEFKLINKGEDGKETELFTYKLEDEFINESRETLVKTMVGLGVRPDSEEGILVAEEIARGSYLAKNWDKILRAAITNAESRIIEKQDKERAGMESPDRNKPNNTMTNTGASANEFFKYFADKGVKRKS